MCGERGDAEPVLFCGTQNMVVLKLFHLPHFRLNSFHDGGL